VSLGDAGTAGPAGDAATAVAGTRLVQVVSGLDDATFVRGIPGRTELLVLEQGGRIRRVEDGMLASEPFLDISERVVAGGERGLLGLALHPDYAENGRFFVHYSSVTVPDTEIDDGDGVVSEFARSAGNPLTADPASERRILVIDQPYPNHNGGNLAFSPKDGFLYIGLGDGGSGGDPQGYGQNMMSLLGKMLRIDVDSRAAGQYGIPAGNMTGDGVRPEIWSSGLRNPWRYSFDSETGDLYIGDVGQSAVEEVDFEPRGEGGRNYGWNVMEGKRCFRSLSCDQSGLTLPVIDYPRDFGCSITGGYVYRGRALPSLVGTYLYADYCSGRFGALRMDGGELSFSGEVTAQLNPDSRTDISSFGVDNDGEIYVLTRGTLFALRAE
jgi:glucose/arabinose dehydrogenase